MSPPAHDPQAAGAPVSPEEAEAALAANQAEAEQAMADELATLKAQNADLAEQSRTDALIDGLGDGNWDRLEFAYNGNLPLRLAKGADRSAAMERIVPVKCRRPLPPGRDMALVWDARIGQAGVPSRTAGRDQRFDHDVRPAFTAKMSCSRVNPQAGCNPIKDVVLSFASPVARDTAHAAEVLTQLREAGASLALDDFGTGFSSLSYLARLPFDTLKIDRYFVLTMNKDEGSAKIVKSVVNLGRDLSLEVVAEGVEDEAQLALPSQCRLSTETPEQVFAQSHPLGQWCYGFSQGFASWPKPKDLNDPTTQYRFSLAAELSLFRDKPMAQMLHAAAGSELPFMEFCKRQRQNMKTALNQLLQLDEYQAVPGAQAALDPTQPPATMRAEARTDSAQPALVLQAIMRSNGQAHAVISGQQVKVGDDLGGARLRAIYAHSVVLERQGQQEVLRLVEPIMKLSR